MGHCGKWGLARAIPMIESDDPGVRSNGILVLCAFFGRPWHDIPLSGPENERILRGLDPETRVLATRALASLSPALDKINAAQASEDAK